MFGSALIMNQQDTFFYIYLLQINIIKSWFKDLYYVGYLISLIVIFTIHNLKYAYIINRLFIYKNHKS